MPDAGSRESHVPADSLSEIAADEGRDEGARVDTHVENRKPGIAPAVIRPVQAADDDADVRL